MSKKIFWFIGILAVCVIAIIVLKDVQKEAVDIDYDNQPFIGDVSAPVDIVEFGDYKCPHCKEFNDSLFPIINEELVTTGKAKFYFMNFPFIGPDSYTAAQFAETVYLELGNEKFWEFHHLLFANQTTSSGGMNYFSDDFMKEVLAEVVSSEETKKVVQAYNEGKGKDPLEKDMNTANNLGITSTPTIYIDGKLFEGKDMNDFIKMVDEAITSGE